LIAAVVRSLVSPVISPFVGADPGQIELDQGAIRNRGAAARVAARLRSGALLVGIILIGIVLGIGRGRRGRGGGSYRMGRAVGRLLRVLGLSGRRPQHCRDNQNRTGDTHVDSQLIGPWIQGRGSNASLSDRRRSANAAFVL
jgi:hypothetical protein